MRAMVLEKVGMPLVLKELPCPVPQEKEVLIRVLACGVCRTDLHIVEGELKEPSLPLILGHQIVGVVHKVGRGVTRVIEGQRVGVPWLGGCCDKCEFCLSERENLCALGVYTGYQRQGGYAEYCVAQEDFILPLTNRYQDSQMAPLLCAGLIGYRAFKLVQAKKTIGFYGFGSSAHLLIQAASFLRVEVYVFTRPGDKKKQDFALSLGAKWVGGSDELPPIELDGALIFAPSGELYPQALKGVKKGGRVVSAGIHMSDIPSFPYELLWGERSISSVANLTRQDGREFMELIEQVDVKASVTVFPLEKANEALALMKRGSFEGSLVLVC